MTLNEMSESAANTPPEEWTSTQMSGQLGLLALWFGNDTKEGRYLQVAEKMLLELHERRREAAIIAWARERFSRWRVFSDSLQRIVSETLANGEMVHHSAVWRLVRPNHLSFAARAAGWTDRNEAEFEKP